jgi:hypothetical protein
MNTYVSSAGEFNRDADYITTRITADGRDGGKRVYTEINNGVYPRKTRTAQMA